MLGAVVAGLRRDSIRIVLNRWRDRAKSLQAICAMRHGTRAVYGKLWKKHHENDPV
jgi:hypothetical protein